jgi:Tfp pilus assembly protein PilF
VSRAAAQLREKLGVEPVTETEKAAVQATIASSPEAARFYAEGLGKLRLFDSRGARNSLEKAVAFDPDYALGHLALASAWSDLGVIYG